MNALASAKIIPLPTAALLPVVQVPRRGPFSRSSGVVSLGAVRRRLAVTLGERARLAREIEGHLGAIALLKQSGNMAAVRLASAHVAKLRAALADAYRTALLPVNGGAA